MKNIAKKFNNSFINFYLWVFGIFSTMPIISFAGITVYVWMLTILFFLILIYITIDNFKLKMNPDGYLILLFGLEIISYIICANQMPNVWRLDLNTSIIQFIFLVVIYLFFSSYKKSNSIKFFIEGIYYASIIQLFWGFLQLIFSIRGGDLNNFVFTDLLHMTEGYATQYQFGNLKISGLCWNAGNLVPLIIFGYVYTKNIYIKALFLILSFLSGSRTLYISMITLICLGLFFRTRKRRRITKENVVLITFLVILILFIALYYNEFIRSLIIKISNLLDFAANVKTEGSTSNHLFYLTSILQITKRNSLLNNLVGYGPGCSGYVFSKFYNIYNNGVKWVVECDYVNELWSYGYLGFIVYYIWYLSNVRKVIMLNKKYAVLFIAFLVAGFFYNITFNWVFLLIIFIFTYSKNHGDIFEEDLGDA